MASQIPKIPGSRSGSGFRKPCRGERNFWMQRREAKIGLRDRKCHRRPKEPNDTGENTHRNGLSGVGAGIRQGPLAFHGRSGLGRRRPRLLRGGSLLGGRSAVSFKRLKRRQRAQLLRLHLGSGHLEPGACSRNPADRYATARDCQGMVRSRVFACERLVCRCLQLSDRFD